MGNASCTNIYFETDVYQTWLSEATLMPSFVEREHTTLDLVNNIPENLQLGEYITNSSVDVGIAANWKCYNCWYDR